MGNDGLLSSRRGVFNVASAAFRRRFGGVTVRGALLERIVLGALLGAWHCDMRLGILPHRKRHASNNVRL